MASSMLENNVMMEIMLIMMDAVVFVHNNTDFIVLSPVMENLFVLFVEMEP